MHCTFLRIFEQCGIWTSKYHIILVGTYVPMQFGIVMERFSENGVWRPEINFGHFGMLDAPPF